MKGPMPYVRSMGSLSGQDGKVPVLPVSNSLANRPGLGGWPCSAGAGFSDLPGEPCESFKVVLEGLPGVEVILVVKDSDRALVTGPDDYPEHGQVMLSLAEGQNLGLCGGVHPIEVDTVEVRQHLFQVLGPVPDALMTMMPVVDDPDMAVTFLVESPADSYEVLRFSAPSAMVIKSESAAELCSPYGEGPAGGSSSLNILGP